jgi:hypothetical protein
MTNSSTIERWAEASNKPRKLPKVLWRDTPEDLERVMAKMHQLHDDYRCGGPEWHKAEAEALAAALRWGRT